MSDTPTLVVVLVDALAADYVQPHAMPFLARLAGKGRKVALQPSPFFSGADPILFGCGGVEMGRFAGYCFDSQRSPYCAVGQNLKWLDRIPQTTIGKFLRTLYARRLLHRAKAGWLPPQFFPSDLLHRLAPPLDRAPLERHIVSKLEKKDYIARWYTRDFRYEGKKWLGSRIFALRYRQALKDWVLNVQPGGPPGLILFEWSVLLDRVGHKQGPSLQGALQKASQRVDRELEELWQGMQDWPNLHWLVISDHGMSQVDRFWDLEGCLKQAGLWKRLRHNTIISSTLAQMQITDSGFRNEVAAVLTETGCGEAIPFERFSEFGIPPDRCWGDLVFALEEGTVMMPNHFQGRRTVRGMHGYAVSSQDSSRPVALAYGPGWDVAKWHDNMSMESVYPAILNLFREAR